MTTITIVVDSLWRHNENCCYANTRSQGQASCLLTLEFKCHLRYCSSQEVDVSLSHSAVLHYTGSSNGLVPSGNINWANVDPVLCCHMASQGHTELRTNPPKWPNVYVTYDMTAWKVEPSQEYPLRELGKNWTNHNYCHTEFSLPA